MSSSHSQNTYRNEVCLLQDKGLMLSLKIKSQEESIKHLWGYRTNGWPGWNKQVLCGVMRRGGVWEADLQGWEIWKKKLTAFWAEYSPNVPLDIRSTWSTQCECQRSNSSKSGWWIVIRCDVLKVRSNSQYQVHRLSQLQNDLSLGHAHIPLEAISMVF